MDLAKISEKLLSCGKKYRYPILVLLIGILLMTLPQKKTSDLTQETLPQAELLETDMAKDLEEILSQIKGVGKVQVLLTQATGERYEYQQDANNADSADTVIVSDADRNQSPVLVQTLPPEYLGAIIVCQGAGSPEVKLAIVEAVSRATGLTADRISVLKMK